MSRTRVSYNPVPFQEIRKLRYGVSFDRFAELMGISRTSAIKLERGEAGYAIVVKVARKLNLTFDQIRMQTNDNNEEVKT